VDGYQVCSRLHAEPSLSETLTVALTGYNPKGPDQQRGFYRYLTKPVELDTLEKLLADIHHAADCKKKRP
jgi:CheY-like chemotaxis protein